MIQLIDQKVHQHNQVPSISIVHLLRSFLVKKRFSQLFFLKNQSDDSCSKLRISLSKRFTRSFSLFLSCIQFRLYFWNHLFRSLSRLFIQIWVEVDECIMFVQCEIVVSLSFTILQAMRMTVFSSFKTQILATLEVWNKKYTHFDAMCLESSLK